MSKVDGGPAFPGEKSVRFGQANDCNEGMSLRDYFAAHAPHEPAHWFVPKNVEHPLKWSEQRIKLPHHSSAKINHCEKCDKYFAAQASLDKRNDELKSVFRLAQRAQWPWAYADAMIAARETKKS